MDQNAILHKLQKLDKTRLLELAKRYRANNLLELSEMLALESTNDSINKEFVIQELKKINVNDLEKLAEHYKGSNLYMLAGKIINNHYTNAHMPVDIFGDQDWTGKINIDWDNVRKGDVKNVLDMVDKVHVSRMDPRVPEFLKPIQMDPNAPAFIPSVQRFMDSIVEKKESKKTKSKKSKGSKEKKWVQKTNK